MVKGEKVKVVKKYIIFIRNISVCKNIKKKMGNVLDIPTSSTDCMIERKRDGMIITSNVLYVSVHYTTNYRGTYLFLDLIL